MQVFIESSYMTCEAILKHIGQAIHLDYRKVATSSTFARMGSSPANKTLYIYLEHSNVRFCQERGAVGEFLCGHVSCNAKATVSPIDRPQAGAQWTTTTRG